VHCKPDAGAPYSADRFLPLILPVDTPVPVDIYAATMHQGERAHEVSAARRSMAAVPSAVGVLAHLTETKSAPNPSDGIRRKALQSPAW
jgi:hypothetical protein